MFIVAEMRIMNNKRFNPTNESDTEHMSWGQKYSSHPALESIQRSHLNRKKNDKNLLRFQRNLKFYDSEASVLRKTKEDLLKT